MNKEEILKKAQLEKNDEREEQVKVKASHIGWISVTVVILFIIIFRKLHGESIIDIAMIVMVQAAAVSFYQYFNMREKKSYLYSGILSIIGFTLAFAALLSEYGVY